ncbi:hypothetical protein [Glaciimonas immobilis]|uniref:Uncharacterized protein n=1 Tax=Glaciimonas immobilis TaxID=728004 RepID=A0A840RKI2_9BURK|nr:hypothetical protein [Glaciimonas immobilis]KAF3998894.1 hypothetical protein HAV38_02730 [Glaciimonas immobilis]MBB5198293.1 hypothetical protein [Glaciimonas immobilis]
MNTKLQNHNLFNHKSLDAGPALGITGQEMQSMVLIWTIFMHVAVKSGYISDQAMVALTRRQIDSGESLALCPDDANVNLKKVWDYSALQVNGIGSPEIPDAFTALAQGVKYAELMHAQVRALASKQPVKKVKA